MSTEDIPTSTDWRALCEELADELTGYKVANPMHCQALLDRARAALAQPEPVGPTDEELDSAFHEHCWTEDDLMDHDDFVKAARAVLARWSRPAIQPEPEVVGPSDEELEALAQELDDVPVQAVFAFARAVLARWGHHTSQEVLE